MKTSLTLLPLLFLASAPLASAQYSSDPALNLAVADLASDEVQPLIVANLDGGAYVSWFSSDPAGTPAFGYDVRLQRLDAAGNEMWGPGGVLIADRGFSSTQDYSLDVDPAGNALLAFRDDRSGSTQVTATKVDASGTQVWGPNGVQVTNTSAFLAAPVISGTSDGAVMVAWTQSSNIGMQRLDTSGLPTWGSGITLNAGSANYSVADMHAADGGSAILSFVFSSGGFGSPRHLYAQKVSSAGVQQWGAGHVQVFDGGSLQFGAFPNFVTDEAGGAVFSWYSSSPSLEVFAQRVLSNGTEAFPHNGVSVSTNGAQLRVGPAVAFDAVEQETFVLYEELNGAQSLRGLSAQKFDVSGARAWGATGLSLLPLGASSKDSTAVVATENGAQLFWIESPGFSQDVLRAQTVDDAGAVVHGASDLSSVPARKFRVSAVRSTSGVALVTWQDDSSGSDNILVQNYLPNGGLGGAATSSSRNGAGINPVVYTAITEPVIGALWQTAVDKSGMIGNTGSVLYVYGAPSSGLLLPQGEVLVDLFSPSLLVHFANSGPVTDTRALPIPPVAALIGIQLATQVLILHPTALVLTNALDLTLGL
ncbi:MAG: hypothetical protein ACI9D0_001511 [Bacteroidia bacterium]|jgi:hypothetical protein